VKIRAGNLASSSSFLATPHHLHVVAGVVLIGQEDVKGLLVGVAKQFLPLGGGVPAVVAEDGLDDRILGLLDGSPRTVNTAAEMGETHRATGREAYGRPLEPPALLAEHQDLLQLFCNDIPDEVPEGAGIPGLLLLLSKGHVLAVSGTSERCNFFRLKSEVGHRIGGMEKVDWYKWVVSLVGPSLPSGKHSPWWNEDHELSLQKALEAGLPVEDLIDRYVITLPDDPLELSAMEATMRMVAYEA
jgi:hypothetical protein